MRILLVVLFLCLLPSSALGDIAATALTNGGDTTCNGPTTATASITPTANALVVACFYIEDGDATITIPTAAGNGLTWEQIGTTVGSFGRLTAFRAMGASPTSGALTFTVTDNYTNCTWAVGEFTGVDTSGSNGAGAIVGSPEVSNSAVSPLTLTLPAFASTDHAGYGCFGNLASQTMTVGSGFTQIGTQSGCCGSKTFHEWKLNDNSVDVTFPSGNTAGIAVEIAIASASVPHDDTQIYGRNLLWDALVNFVSLLFSPSEAQAATYYLDANLSGDCTGGNYSITNRSCTGSDGIAYNDFQEVCTAIGTRVGSGTKGDDVIIREGTYERSPTNRIIYNCLLNGTTGDHTLVTAKTCSANAPGCVKRHDGNWYEKVTFDDMRTLTETWTTTGTANVYKATVNFTSTTDPWVIDHVTKAGTRTTGGGNRQVADNASNYGFTSVKPGPYRMLVDGKPSQWYDYDYTLTETQNTARLAEGSHTFNRTTNVFYARFVGNTDPRTSGQLIETWKQSDAFLAPRWEYVDIRGIEFRGILLFFKLVNNNLIDYLKHVTWAGNQWTDGLTMIVDARGKCFTQFGCSATNGGATNFTLRDDVDFTDNIFIRQSREIWQMHGTNHDFLRNWVLDGTPQWSGGFDSYPKYNPRNTPGGKFNYNFLYGHIGSYRFAAQGNIETTSTHQAAAGGTNCEYNNQEFIGNYFESFTRSTVFTLGGSSTADPEGECGLQGVKINSNIFVNNNSSNATLWMKNELEGGSEIKNNAFYSKSGGNYIDVDNNSRAAVQTNNLSVSDNIFMNGPTVFDTDFCAASGITKDRNIFNGNSATGCTGTNPITSAATFLNPSDRDFRPAPGSPAIVSGTDIGPYNDGTTPPTGMDFWNVENDLAPRLAALRVNEGATTTVIVDFKLGLPGFSFGPILPAASTSSHCAGLTFKKNGSANTVTDCDKVSATQWAVTVTNAYACADTISASYDPATGAITDSAVPVELRQELVEETDFAGTNLITTGCGGTPPDQPVFTLTQFRLKRWPGPTDSTDWLSAADTDYRVTAGSHLRARVQIVNSAAGGTLTPTLQCNAAGGTYLTVTDDCAGDGLTDDAPFCYGNPPNVIDPAIPSGQLASCGGTQVSGQLVLNGTPHPPVTMELNGCVEIEFALQVKPALSASANPLRCQIVNSAGTVLPFGGSLTGTTNWAQRISSRSHMHGGGLTGGQIE